MRADLDLVVLAFIVLTLPLELSKQLFPVQVIEISRLGMIAGFGVLAYRAVQRRLVAVPWSVFAAILVMVAASGASLALTRWGNGIRIEAALATYALFAVFVTQSVRDVRGLRVVGGALIASGVMVAVVLVLESSFDFYLWREGTQGVLGRRNGTFADPNITSRFLALAFVAVLAAVASLQRPTRWTRTGLLLASLLFGAGQALTQSRAGWLTTIVVIVLWVAFARPWRRALVPVALLVLGFAGAVVADPTALLHASSTFSDTSTAVGATGGASTPAATSGPSTTIGPGRTIAPARPGATVSPAHTSVPVLPVDDAVPDTGPALWIDPFLQHVPLDSVRRYLVRAGVAMFADNPIAGVGLGGFQPEILGPYSAFIPAERRAFPASLPHSEIVRIAAETGVVGLVVLVLLMAMIARVLWSVRRARAPVGAAAGAVALGIVAILVASQFEGRLIDEPYFWLLVGLGAALPRVASTARDVVPADR